MSLKIENLFKAYGEKKILDNFSYEFKDTGLYIVSGESGIGKTTLLRIISGIDKKYTGYISGGGFENVSVSFQEYRLFPNLTAIRNISEVAFKNPSEENIEKAKKALLDLGFTESEINLLPPELSGGMKQRVSLARAFLKTSPILILDEPTKELDRELSLKVMKIIENESKKRLVIMVTHNEADLAFIPHTKIVLKQHN